MIVRIMVWFIFFINKLTFRLINGFNYWIKFILIIIFIIYFQSLFININLKSFYNDQKSNNSILENKTKIFKNLTVYGLFDNKIFKLNNTEIKEFSGQYEEIPSTNEIINNNNNYFIEDIYFLLTTNTKRIYYTIDLLRFWTKYPNIKCLIVFEEKDLINNKNIIKYLLNEGIQCEIDISNVTRFEERYVQLIEYGFNKINKFKWFIIGDDDTIWFMNNLLNLLKQYNSSKLFYIGNISYRNESIKKHGNYFAYGGGGILLSKPLVSLFIKYNKQCKQFFYLYGGDEIIGKCITNLLNINLTINENFHQIDHMGDMYGYLQSGINNLVSLHHIFISWEPFPQQHTIDEKQVLDIIDLSYKTFNQLFLKRFFKINYQTNQTLLFTIGYSFTLFNRILLLEELNQVEMTWCCSPSIQKINRKKENNNINWYFKRLKTNNFNHHIINSSIYQNTDKYINNYIPNLEIIFN